MQERKDAGQEGCRTGRMQDRKDAGQEGYRNIHQLDVERCRTGRIQEYISVLCSAFAKDFCVESQTPQRMLVLQLPAIFL